MPPLKDITGLKFNLLTVLGQSKIRKNNRILWICRCVCGNVVETLSGNLKNGIKKSCGCLRENSLKNLEKRTTHGMSKSRPYKIWRGMVTRCYNKSEPYYKNYGGRGIVVCDKWKKFEGFWEDMSTSYKEDLTLNRINNNLNYYKKNCKWSTMSEQARNKRNSFIITRGKDSRNVHDWSDILKIKPNTLKLRFKKGWDIKRVLNPHLEKGELRRANSLSSQT